MTGSIDGGGRLGELARLDPLRRVRVEMDLVADLFDADYYTAHHPGVVEDGQDPLKHFCTVGWRDLLKPYAGFDVWWYWMTHLDPATEDVNPLVHYALVGRAEGLATRPSPPSIAASTPPAGAVLPQDRPVRRACLFAGFDPEGTVDDATLLLLRELSRFADVYYLCDAYLPPEELDKVREVALEAWSVRHGAYDFGSYSLLARELVGWERLAGYDEVLLVNDSCYLLRPLDEVFATMDATACDWWGLQATKGLASTLDNPANHLDGPVPLDRVREELLAAWEDDAVYDFHLGSYFLAFRGPVLADERFRALLDSVHPQQGKLRVVLKYEVGLTHLLLGRGYAWDTFVPALYPFHPLFSAWYFTLLEQGFPLLKRYLLFQNHYDLPGLARWKERVLAVVPDAPVEVFEDNLLRTAPADRLSRSLSIDTDEDGRVRVPTAPAGRAFATADAATGQREDCWVFAVDDRHLLPDNSRAVFEQVRHDPSITKVILTRGRRLDLPGPGVEVLPMSSPAGRERLMQARTVFVAARPRRTLGVPVSLERHDVIAVRGGLMLEKEGRLLASPTGHTGGRPPATGPMPWLHDLPAPTLTALLVASDLDRVAAVAAHWPARYGDAWPTGLPMHDLLVADREDLPGDLREQESRLRGLLGGRRLLLFAPTLRRTGTTLAPATFTDAQVARLRAWTERTGTVLGIREPVGDLERPYSARLGGIALDVSPVRFPSTPAVLRASDAVLTDYNGIALDFSATGRPVISLAHDLDSAADRLVLDLDHLFPGPVCRDVDALIDALETLFDEAPAAARRYERARALLLDPPDGRAARRVVDRVRELAATRRRR